MKYSNMKHRNMKHRNMKHRLGRGHRSATPKRQAHRR